MYINYEDTHDQLIDTASRAIEGDQTHLRIQRGSVTINLTANQQSNTPINFGTQFTANNTPTIKLSLTSVGSISAKTNLVAANKTATGYTLQAYSDTTHTISVDWMAVGKAE